MIKLVYVIRKRADVSDKDFHEYWLKKHGPLVRGFAKAMRAKNTCRATPSSKTPANGFETPAQR